jgi:hypothetical protein
MTTFSMTEVCHIVMREGITCYIEHTGGGVMTIFAGKLVGEVGHGALWTVAAGPGHQVDRIVVASTEDFYVGQGGTSFSRIEYPDLWKCPSNATVADIAAEIIHQVRQRDAQTPVVTPDKTWPETDAERDAFIDWQYEVGTGGELRGFRDWLAEKESAS